jgi:hypothetical protein
MGIKSYNNYIVEEFEEQDFEPIKSFKIHNTLNDSVWDGDKIKPEIKKSLINVAQDYFDYIEVKADIKDIYFTGSLANYNYSEYSDFDIHLVIDFTDVNDDVELVQRYLDFAEKLWKEQHDIKIEGYEAELYCQDINHKMIATGIYSLMSDEWIRKPSKIDWEPDDELIKKKASKLMSAIDELIETSEDEHIDYHELKDKMKKTWKKVKGMRQAGLDSKEGEYSTENLVFKLLRRNGYIGKYMALKRKMFDKKYA